MEFDEEYEVVKQYISGSSPDSWIGFIQEGEAYYYLKNNSGSIEEIVSNKGEVVASYSYDVFGNLINVEEQILNHIRFTGREYDEESGLYYYRMRHYDPAIGRFIQPDLHPGTSERPLTMVNRYIYALNNPVNLTDPYGLYPDFNGLDELAQVFTDFISWLFGHISGNDPAPVSNSGSIGDVQRNKNELWMVEKGIQTNEGKAREKLSSELGGIDEAIGIVGDLAVDLFDWDIPWTVMPLLDTIFVQTDGSNTRLLDYTHYASDIVHTVREFRALAKQTNEENVWPEIYILKYRVDSLESKIRSHLIQMTKPVINGHVFLNFFVPGSITEAFAEFMNEILHPFPSKYFELDSNWKKLGFAILAIIALPIVGLGMLVGFSFTLLLDLIWSIVDLALLIIQKKAIPLSESELDIDEKIAQKWSTDLKKLKSELEKYKRLKVVPIRIKDFIIINYELFRVFYTINDDATLILDQRGEMWLSVNTLLKAMNEKGVQFTIKKGHYKLPLQFD